MIKEMKNETTIYVDMDGVLAKWEEVSEEETHLEGYFASRKPEINIINLVKRLKAEGFDVRILSAVYSDNHSAKDKEAWLSYNGLSDFEKIFVPYGEEKTSYIKKKSLNVLIDDFGKNLNQWEKAGYLPVKFMNQINSRPKMIMAEDGSIQLKLDTWSKSRLDYRMSSEQMYQTLIGIIASEFITKEVA